MTKDDAVPVTAEAREAAADLLNEVSSLLGDDGIGQVADLIRDGEYDEHDATLAFARFERDILARHRGSTAGVDVDALRPLREITALSADPASKRILCLHFSREIGGEHREAILAAVNLAPRDDAALASLSQTPATPMDELQRLGQEYDGAATIPTDHPLARSLRTSQKALDEIARQEQANIAGYMALRDFPVGSTASPMVQEGLREALAIGEKFLNACFSAWACGEPHHRVKTMMDRADEFRAALDALSATPAQPVDETERLKADPDLERHIFEWFNDLDCDEMRACLEAYDAKRADRTQEGEVRRG